MNILYCRITWMKAYKGMLNDSTTGGGEYVKENIPFEIYNFLGNDGYYYGFVEPGVNCSLHVERFGVKRNDDSADGVLVVWVARKPSGGEYIIGWYRNATVYRNLQAVPDIVLENRDINTINRYNVLSQEAVLLDPAERTFLLSNMGRKNIWYGNDEIDTSVVEYIDKYETSYDKRIETIEKNLTALEGKERETIVKERVNQDVFRSNLIKKYKHCCLCGVDEPSLLIASHIKPWKDSDKYEKLDVNNGLLLCPDHDKAFDLGFISFSDNGEIIISEKLSEINRTFLNIHKGMKILVTDENCEYLKYHRTRVYQQ